MAGRSSKDELYAQRVARLLVYEGHLVRRSVDLRAHFGADFKNTEIDIFALRLDETLAATVTLGDCRATGERGALGAGERALRSVGLRRLAGAQHSFIASIKPASPQVRRIAEQLSVAVIDEHDLARREEAFHIERDSPWGPADERLWRGAKEVSLIATGDEDLKRIWWFVRSEFWFAQEVVGLKRGLGALRLLARRHGEGHSRELSGTLRWLAHQTQACVVLALVRIAGRALSTPPKQFTERLLEQLSEGVASFDALREISRQVDHYLMVVLRQAGVAPAQSAEALGVFEPQPPPYTEPLLELITRMAAEPIQCRELPRLLDWQIASVELDEPLGLRSWPGLDRGAGRLLRLVRAFLRGQLALPEDLLQPLTGEPLGKAQPQGGELRLPGSLPAVPSTVVMPTLASKRRPPVSAEDGSPRRALSAGDREVRASPSRERAATVAPDADRDDLVLEAFAAEQQERRDTAEPLKKVASRSGRRKRPPLSRSGRGTAISKRSAAPGTQELSPSTPISEALMPGADEHHGLRPAHVDGKRLPVPASLAIAVQNVSETACRVVAAIAYAKALGSLAGEVPLLLLPGEEARLRFALSNETSELREGECVTVELTDDEGREHRMVLRHSADGHFTADHPSR
jgi:hypothetical protein